MYRLLVVDNEAYVVETVIFYMEEQSGLDLEVYGCYSAGKALEMMEQMRVDVLLTDIRMPDMDGLKLQEEVMARWPRCKTIFLSGYDDFDYIQRAFRTGGCNYLLKSEGKEAIIAAVAKACRELDAQLAQEVLLSRAQERWAAALPVLRQQLYHSLLSLSPPQEKQRKDAFARMGLDFDPEQKVYLLLAHHDQAGTQDQWQNELCMTQVKNVLLQHMPSMLVCDGLAYGDMAAWLFQPRGRASSEQWRRVRLQISESLQNIQAVCQQHLSMSVSFALGGQPVAWEGLHGQRKRLEARLHTHLLDGALLLELEPELPPSAAVNTRACETLDQAKLLYTYLDTGNRADFMALFDALVKAVGEVHGEMQRDLQLEVLSRVGSMFLSQLNRWSMAEQLARQQDLQPLRQRLFTMPWSEAIHYLRSLADAFFNTKNQQAVTQEVDLVARLHWLVQQNLGGDLSLTRLGDMLGMNPYYMARLYQVHTGERLVNHIASLRIDRAKELLDQDVLTSRDIGRAIGYGSAQAFHRFFKKMTGMTPQEYKNKSKTDD